MRKKLLIGAVSLLGLVLLLFITAIFYIRSGRLDRYVQSEILSALAEVGIRAEIGSTKLDLGGYRVTLKDIRLLFENSSDELGSIEEIEVTFSVISYLSGRVRIDELKIQHPRLKLFVDEQGKLNLSRLRSPPSKGDVDEEEAVTFLGARATIENGEIDYEDRLRNIKALIPDLQASIEPAALLAQDRLNHDFTLSFEKGSASVDGRPVQRIAMRVSDGHVEAPDDLKASTARVGELRLEADGVSTTLKGEISSFDPVTYKFDTRADIDLGEISRIGQLGPMSGRPIFVGTVQGTGSDYKLRGSLESGSLSAAGFTISSARVEADGAGKVERNGSTGVSYRADVNARTGSVAGRGVAIDSVRLTEAILEGRNEDFGIEGGLQVGSVKTGKVELRALSARIEADRETISLPTLQASLLGGKVSGSANVSLVRQASRLKLKLSSIDLNQAATLAAQNDVTINGNANADVDLSFPGFDYEAATGRIVSTFEAQLASTKTGAEASPTRGELTLAAGGRTLNVEKAAVRSANSELTASGTISWEGNANLNIGFRSSDVSEIQRAIDGFGLIPEESQQKYPYQVSGPGEFSGTVRGDIENPTVNGHLKLASIESRGTDLDPATGAPAAEELGSFEGDIAFSPAELRVENASITRGDGSRADFVLGARLKEENGISVKATVKDFDLATIARAADIGLADVGGVVNGSFDLRGLPGPRTIEGTASVTLSNAQIEVPSTEEGKESQTVEIPEFAGDVTFANSVLSVQNLRMTLGDSPIEGTGQFNLDTYAYKIDAKGQNIDLAQAVDIVGTNESIRVTGRADLNIQGDGLWGKEDSDDWSQLKLNATIQGKDVAINGRSLGDARVIANTVNGVLNIEATGNVLNEPRTLVATVDLRERKTYPVNANIEFTDTEVGPYLSLVSPDLAGINGRASGTIRLSGPLLEPEAIEARATLTKLEVGGSLSPQRQYIITNQDPIVLTASQREVKIERVRFTGESTSVVIEGVLAKDGGDRSRLSINGELNLRFLSSFTDAVFTTGVARLEAAIVGSLSSPQLLGTVNLNEVGVRVVDFPLSLSRGSGQIRFTSNQALIENFTASAPGGGSVSVGGGAALEGLVPARWRIQVDADQVGIEYPRDTLSVFDARATLQGNRVVQVFSGDLDIRRASYTKEITIDELIRTGGPFSEDIFQAGPAGGGAGVGLKTTLDLRINADNSLVVRNNLVDAVGSAFINVRGPIEEPLISGRVLLSRGNIEFRGGRHELSRGIITIPGRRGAEPVIDIQTEADIRGYHITTTFTGTPSKPHVITRSEPELPEADIISLIITGNLNADRGTTAAASGQSGLGLAQSLLSASFTEQLEKQTQRLFGLSRISIDPLLLGRGGDLNARVTLGQQITKDFTITYSQNLTSSGASGIDRIVLVEYRISNRFSIIGFRNERNETGFDIRYRKRF